MESSHNTDMLQTNTVKSFSFLCTICNVNFFKVYLWIYENMNISKSTDAK